MNRVCQNKLAKRIFITALLGMVLFISFSTQADEKIQLELVTVQGSRELPKVIYIVPWKRLETNAKDQKLILHSLFQDAFDPLEPEAFERRVKKYKDVVK